MAHILQHSGYSNGTIVTRSAMLRKRLRYLWSYYGSEKLDDLVPKGNARRPRSVVANDEERTRLLANAPPDLKLFLLLCSDLGIRSGTAVTLGHRHYDRESQTLRFETKKGARLTLPVTAEIAALIERCKSHDLPFTRQLAPRALARGSAVAEADRLRFKVRRALASAGITRRLTPHDLRRTTAVRMLEETGDLRDVQALLGHRNLVSTIWYLDHDLRPVSRATLERLKQPRKALHIA